MGDGVALVVDGEGGGSGSGVSGGMTIGTGFRVGAGDGDDVVGAGGRARTVVAVARWGRAGRAEVGAGFRARADGVITAREGGGTGSTNGGTAI